MKEILTNKLLKNNINRLWSSLIIDEFLKNNITHFYLSPGMRNAPLVAALTHFEDFYPLLKLFVCLDERSAAYRALGYTKSTGTPAVLICTSGTAMANYMPAVIEAKKSNLPLIILSADRPSEMTFCDDNQTIDQTKFFGDFVQGEMNLGAPSVDIPPRAMTSSLSNLIHKSLYPQKGPVHFNCAFREPLEDSVTEISPQYIKLCEELISHLGPSTFYIESSTTPSKESITKVCSTLRSAKNGLIVLGALNSFEENSAIKDFISLLKWPCYFDVSSSLKYEFNLTTGSLPTFDHPEFQAELIKNPPDIVLHIGGRLTSKHYYTFLKQVPSINLITLNLNNEKEDPSHHTKIRINASISPTLNLLTQELTSAHYKKPDESPRFLNKNFETFTNQKISLIENGPLSYPRISKMIIDSIPNQSILYLGNSTVVRSFDAYFSYECSKNLIVATNRGVSGIEGFMASSTGFIDGLNQDVYLVIGDVSFFHDLNSLQYLKDCTHHLKIILVNNDGGGIFTLLPIHKEEKVLNVISSPHGLTFKSTAEQFGIPYRKVETSSDFEQSLQDIYQFKGHYILEVTFDHETNKKVYDQLKTIKL